MKVRIKESTDAWWYMDKVGRVFPVKPGKDASGRPIYTITEGAYKSNYLLADHCKVYEEIGIMLPEDMFEL